MEENESTEGRRGELNEAHEMSGGKMGEGERSD